MKIIRLISSLTKVNKKIYINISSLFSIYIIRFLINIFTLPHLIKNYGADAVRFFILSDSPPEKDVQWSDQGMKSSYKFVTLRTHGSHITPI